MGRVSDNCEHRLSPRVPDKTRGLAEVSNCAQTCVGLLDMIADRSGWCRAFHL
jgi:hypothetical protein